MVYAQLQISSTHTIHMYMKLYTFLSPPRPFHFNAPSPVLCGSGMGVATTVSTNGSTSFIIFFATMSPLQIGQPPFCSAGAGC